MSKPNLAAFFANVAQLDNAVEANAPAIGRPKKEIAASDLERQHACRQRKREARERDIAILDMETEPFDNELKTSPKPFLAVLYCEEFEPVIIWEENLEQFRTGVVRAIENLPRKFTVYAHNGGGFDFLFLMSKLRGDVKFKGRKIMSARIGSHELRDSYHIIPEKLAAYQKDKFDYNRMKAGQRDNWRKEIIDYCLADCRYLLEIVRAFIGRYGRKLTIGQAAMAKLSEHYDVTRINGGFDDYLRKWYFGGRVECVQGLGIFAGDFKLFDVNSEYPYVMAAFQHPIGGFHDYTVRRGNPGEDTVFLQVQVGRNRNALIGRQSDGSISSTVGSGTFQTTIWEYRTAIKYGLIEDVTIDFVVDCSKRTSFEKFILPIYDERQQTKALLAELKAKGMQHSAAFVDAKKDDIFYKLILNNAYGKFATNPKNFVEHYVTDPNEEPPPEWFKSLAGMSDAEQIGYRMPTFENSSYAIWQKPSPSFRYYNVGTAASITGAARAVLLDGLQNAAGAIYCDTDSIICTDLRNVPVHKTQLGAWDLEDEFSRVIVNGKKLYAVWHKTPKVLTPEDIVNGRDPRYTVKSKGGSRITWDEMVRMNSGENIVKVNFAPTLTKFNAGEILPDDYMTRTFKATAKAR